MSNWFLQSSPPEPIGALSLQDPADGIRAARPLDPPPCPFPLLYLFPPPLSFISSPPLPSSQNLNFFPAPYLLPCSVPSPLPRPSFYTPSSIPNALLFSQRLPSSNHLFLQPIFPFSLTLPSSPILQSSLPVPGAPLSLAMRFGAFM